eukprot:m.24492 g.24492  ORF g.24492 m.24492 type:complete len:63 (+) comp9115_c0_seq1:705-893(+)
MLQSFFFFLQLTTDPPNFTPSTPLFNSIHHLTWMDGPFFLLSLFLFLKNFHGVFKHHPHHDD